MKSSPNNNDLFIIFIIRQFPYKIMVSSSIMLLRWWLPVTRLLCFWEAGNVRKVECSCGLTCSSL
ncbi:unnamed protein product [Brassica rapa subsp. trilocularis]